MHMNKIFFIVCWIKYFFQIKYITKVCSVKIGFYIFIIKGGNFKHDSFIKK